MSTEKRIEYHKRDLLLSDDISEGSVGSIIKDIFEINADDDEKEEIYKEFERKPIRFFINSFGGSVYDGLALVDVIRRSKTPVHTICIHVAMLKFVHSKNYEEWVEPRREYADSKADLIPLLCTVGAVFLGGLVNPYGFTAITYLFRSFGVDTINYLVSEMAAPSFTDSFVIVIFAFATVMLLGLSKKRLPIRYICLAAGTILLSMMHTKGFAYLLLFAIPIIGYSYSDKRFNISFFRRKFIPANYTRFMAILLGLTSLMVVVIKEVYITSSGDIRDTERYGWAEILEYAEENTDISKDSVIYAGYNSGGYLEFYGYRPYLDARAEIFLECNNHQFDYLNEFAVVNTNPLKVEEFVEKYGFEYMFVEQYSSIYEWFKYQGDNCRYELLYEYKETGKKKEQAEENLADEDRKMTLWRLKEPGDIAYDASN